jgi:hypothetical protein
LIQTEAALRWVVHSYALKAEQLDRIIEATKLPNVRLGIIALDAVSPQVAPLHSFHIYDGESVTFGTESGTALLSDPSVLPASPSWSDWLCTTTMPAPCSIGSARTIAAVPSEQHVALQQSNRATVLLCRSVAKP